VLAVVVHPKIEAPLLGMIIAAPLAAVVLGSVARQRAKKAGRKEPGTARAAVWLGGGELALLLAFGIMIPSMCRATEPANRAKCSNNLRQIGLALLMYANDHGGQFPDTLNVLLLTDSEYTLTSDIFTCPSSSDERATGQTPAEVARNLTAEPGHLSYVYVGAGLTTVTATDDRIVAYDNPRNHTDGINVLFGDAHVEFLDRKQAEQAIAKLGPPGTAPSTRPTGASY
jgi:prepilin-type processing-associated H-X9-DG protein